LLGAARRPLVLLGPAMARGPRAAAVERLVEATGVPALPMESPRGFNDPWLHLAAPLLREADLLLLLGKKPDFVVRFADPAHHATGCGVIQVDADAASLRGGATLGIAADPAAVADQLARAAHGRPWSHRAWGGEGRRGRGGGAARGGAGAGAGDDAGGVGGGARLGSGAAPPAAGGRRAPASRRPRRDPDRRRW